MCVHTVPSKHGWCTPQARPTVCYSSYIYIKNSNTCMYTCMMYVNISINNVNVQYIISNTITAGM